MRTLVKNLPPDPEEMNDARAEWAQGAIELFKAATGTDHEDALADLLCDLMHLADRDPDLGTFDDQLARARNHYLAETATYSHLTGD